MFLWSQTYFSIIHNLVLYPVSSKGCHYQKGKKGQSKHLLNTCRFIESTLSRCWVFTKYDALCKADSIIFFFFYKESTGCPITSQKGWFLATTAKGAKEVEPNLNLIHPSSPNLSYSSLSLFQKCDMHEYWSILKDSKINFEFFWVTTPGNKQRAAKKQMYSSPWWMQRIHSNPLSHYSGS